MDFRDPNVQYRAGCGLLMLLFSTLLIFGLSGYMMVADEQEQTC